MHRGTERGHVQDVPPRWRDQPRRKAYAAGPGTDGAKNHIASFRFQRSDR